MEKLACHHRGRVDYARPGSPPTLPLPVPVPPELGRVCSDLDLTKKFNKYRQGK